MSDTRNLINELLNGRLTVKQFVKRTLPKETLVIVTEDFIRYQDDFGNTYNLEEVNALEEKYSVFLIEVVSPNYTPEQKAENEAMERELGFRV